MKIQNKLKLNIAFIIGMLGWICFPHLSLAQRSEVEVPVRQTDNRIQVRLFQQPSSTLFGAFSQDYRVTIENLTQDKLLVQLEYSASLSCGIRKTTQVGPFNEGITINPRETVGKKWGTDGNATAVRLGEDACPRTNLIKLGKDNTGSDLYSAISSLDYSLISIENISEKERQETEALKQKEAEENRKREEARKAKEADAQKQTQEQQQDSPQADTKENADRFWADSPPPTSSRRTRDDDLKPASQFQGGLGDVPQGGYFKDDKGNYFKKEQGGARKVSKSEYDQSEADKLEEQVALQVARQEERREALNQTIDNTMDVLSTTFYAQQLSRGMKDASYLGSNFGSIEELNAAFSQKLKEISFMGDELQTASVQGMNSYTNALSVGATTSSDHTYVAALSVIGSVAASISASNETKRAREELNRQRVEEEAAIKERQRVALVNIRKEISLAFPEGGMPLSSHKINAPILYLFAYSDDKSNWGNGQAVPFSVSNVIPVYRYNDGTYPYASNVKRTFETGGITNPIIVGYFTDKAQAESHRKSLTDLAPNAKFTLNAVEIKVKEQAISSNGAQSSDLDFWGNKQTGSNPQNSDSGRENFFWGMPKKESKPDEKKTEAKKQGDFWNN